MGPDSTLLAYLIITGLVVVGLAMHIYEGDGCLDYCPKSVNYNPVCGTDYVTYINPTYLLCQKKCGEPNLGVAHFSSCADWIIGKFRS